MTAVDDFAVGSLVRARGREWVVLPESSGALILLRPLGGGDDDIAGVLRGVEQVEPATFAPPSADDLGDDRSARLLRDALRVGFRSSGGPFRSLAGLAVDPRPYQLVPLLLALRQRTVRLLIADDVGIGKTVEAGLIAAELLAQGSAQGLSVLCPPSLAEQWQSELKTKFNLDAELVLPATVARLERGLEYGQSLFERYPITVVSADFIKADHRRDDFLRAAPDLLIVDEAHSSVSDDAGRGGRGRTQRYRLLADLAADVDRHLVLVTATPHSGNDQTFRNLIGLLDPTLKTADLATQAGREALSQHMVQRRRAHIRAYLGADTRFPTDRQTKEAPYKLGPAYRELFDEVLRYVQGQVRDRSGTRLQQRVRWWSALSLLRALASSPAAAAATLETRAAPSLAESVQAADALGGSAVLDIVEDEALDAADVVPGALTEDLDALDRRDRATLLSLRDRALAITREEDTKLTMATKTIKGLLADGYSPIVFCRFIQTGRYVASHLAQALKGVPVEVVTGELAHEDRTARVAGLADQASPRGRVLVATDCLSEGVNLQDGFQAVVHYDLAWNPTRHEQREGRVDRFGQPADVVRAVLIYGEENGIDGIVLNVLLRKHEAIRRDLGVSVPVPSATDQVLSALVEGIVLRGRDPDQLVLDFEAQTETRALHEEWQSTAESETRSRSRFTHETIKPEEVRRELDSARVALGSPADVAAFTQAALAEAGGLVTEEISRFVVHPDGLPVGLRDALGRPEKPLPFHLDLPVPRGAAVLHRTDPRVAAVARYTLDAALDSGLPARARPARRCGVVRTNAVTAPTTVLLTRFRFHLALPRRTGTRMLVAEEARALAFTSAPAAPVWLAPGAVDELLAAGADANTPTDTAVNMAAMVLRGLGAVTPHLDATAATLAEELREAHVRVRQAARGARAGELLVQGLTVTPQLPVDVLGVYLYLPARGVR